MKILFVAGARPNFIKIAPLIKAVQNWNMEHDGQIKWELVHTGQHYDVAMSEVFFKELGIARPAVNLEVGSASHTVQTAMIMMRFEEVCLKEVPDFVVVVGDVNSTMACSLVAAKLGMRIAHVEAGLRSFDRTMPEEINRIVTDTLADLLFTPSKDADENLRNEGISESKIKLVGNVMIDTLVAQLEKARKKMTYVCLGCREKEFVYVTLHRPSNVDNKESLGNIIRDLQKLASAVPVVFPVHPRTKKMLREYGIVCHDNNDLKLIEPIGYHDSICLAEHARLVLTDSGGLQEETTFFRTPCLTLRPNTERPITVTKGSNRLTSLESLCSDIEDLLNGPSKRGNIPHLWDGRTADRIVQHLSRG
jgi:UDP-N-acetylglucosamine 2-epimerase (non-hydrolysing)